MTQQGRPSASSAMFAALAVPNFRRYVSGQALSLIGTWVETVAQPPGKMRLGLAGVAMCWARRSRWG
jgi:hypothetical protein